MTEGVHVRFVENLMRYLFHGIDAKDKNVRLRCSQIIVSCITVLTEVSADIWDTFRVKVSERLFDKEASVRCQAVLALTRFQGAAIDESNGIGVVDLFLDLMQHDPSKEVRKAVLKAIAVTETTLPFILQRSRDADADVRKFFFKNKIEEIDISLLSQDARSSILKTGLLDRDPSVQQLCVDMIFDYWITATNSNLLEFIIGLNIVEDKTVANKVLRGFYDRYPDMFRSFGQAYLDNLSAETALIMASYSQFIMETKDKEAVQELLPSLSEFSGYLMVVAKRISTAVDDESEVKRYEFTLKELFSLCLLYDFSDEVGRRQLCTTIAQVFISESVSGEVIQSAVKALKASALNDNDFICMIAEVIADSRAIINVDSREALMDLQNDLQALSLNDTELLNLKIRTNLKTLEIAKYVFSEAPDTVRDDPIYHGFLNELVLPGLSAPFFVLQLASVECLGQACTLNGDIAAEYMNVFLGFFSQAGHETLKLECLKIILDLAVIFGFNHFKTSCGDGKLLGAVMGAFDAMDQETLAIAAEGLAKFFFLGMIEDMKAKIYLKTRSSRTCCLSTTIHNPSPVRESASRCPFSSRPLPRQASKTRP